jgi:hypothetical protein
MNAMFGKKQQQFERYQSPDAGLSNTGLTFGVWFVAHKPLLKTIGLILLIVIAVPLFLYGSINWGIYLISGFDNDRALERDVRQTAVNYDAVQQKLAPQPLSFGSTLAFQSAEGRYDLITSVGNNNPFHIATIRYRYVYSQGSSDLTETVLLPGTKRPVVAFGAASDGFPIGARLVVDHIDWQRIDNHIFSEPQAFVQDRSEFTVGDVTFFRKGSASELDTHRIEFSVTNNMPYSYWQGTFLALYYHQGELEGVAPLLLPQFRAGQTRAVDLRSLSPTLTVSSVELVPLMNVFDSSEFMAPGQ